MAIGITNGVSSSMEQLSSMKKINSAADNAAGLSIVEGMKSQVNGYDTGADNALTGQDYLKVAEGGLSSIGDSLQRIRELSLQASNAIYTDDDRSAIQQEIEQLKGTITDAAKGTEFNTLKPLDGSMADMNLATNPDGSGMKIKLESSTLDALGIADYDVTSGTFDISAIDKALAKVNESRSSIGATSNALDSVVAYNNMASENLSAASSKIEDLDVGKAVSALKKNQVMDEYKMFAMQAKMQQQKSGVAALLG